MKKLVIVMLLLAVMMPVMAQEDDDEQTLTVVTYDSFAMSEEVQALFEEETGIRLEILRLSDAGAMLNQAILTEDNPLGDVLYGVDNAFLSRALAEDLFIPYESPLLENVPEAFQLDAEEFRVTPVTYGDVCLNYDKVTFIVDDLPLPESLMDLTDPLYEGELVVENPAMSSPGLAFLLATIAVFGDEAEDNEYSYLDYWADLVENDVLVVNGWTEAYYGEFSGASEGDRSLVVSYASSPPAEVYFGEVAPEDAPTGSVVADDTCFRQIEFAGILQNTENEEAAQLFIDFLLDTDFQEDLPLQMFVFPVNENAELPQVFLDVVEIPENSLTLDYAVIDENREDWIRAWTEAVLR